MINIKKLEELVLDQKEIFLEKSRGTTRLIHFSKYLSSRQIVVISGIRRCGKSTLLRQFASHIDDFHYINFDDERLLHFTVDDFADLMIVFKKNSNAKTIIIDEIQIVEKWERFIRRIHDEGYKLFITGSNAKMLSSELSTHLTGRYSKIELYPFSFKEFLHFNNLDCKKITSSKKAKILTMLDQYLENGGFPEYLKYNDKEFVKRTYDDILYRDIITRFNIRDIKAFKQLSHYLFSNFTGETSYNSLKNILGFKSTMTVRNYIGFLEEAFLVFEAYKYDYSLKKQHTNNKKVYVIDNGMRNEISFQFSEDKGKQLENLVFIELKRQAKNVYFFRFKNKTECDFVVEEKGKITSVIQVCFDLHINNLSREVKGLQDAMNILNCETGIIVTYNQDDAPLDDSRISVVPVWRWLAGIET